MTDEDTGFGFALSPVGDDDDSSSTTLDSARNPGHVKTAESGGECFSILPREEFWWSKKIRNGIANHVIDVKQLSSIPNRVCTNGKSRTSCLFTQKGHKGINQDTMIVWEDFISEGVTFFGVFDGHGPYGHLVARKVMDSFPLELLSFLHNSLSKKDGEIEFDSAVDDSNSVWREAFLKSYKAMDKELRSHSNLDCFCSGSTAVTIVKQGSNLFVGSVGDSRAILGSKNDRDSMIAIPLTVDLKPDLPSEAERIKRCKGRVFAMQDEPLVPRVWLPFDDALGLAMARAFGDFCLKNYGVISIPEFSHRKLTDRDQFVVVASDGIWDVLSNEEVVEIVSSATTRSLAARILVESATRAWRLKYQMSKMDDCAVICLFLDGKMDPGSDCYELGFSSATIQSNNSGNAMESEDGHDPCLQRNHTVRLAEGNEEVSADNLNGTSLKGFIRVNSLVRLPSFLEEKC